ncbi:unnamed protein product [Lupinus luteus]|uniref:RNase III domain-containing protein n=1 Tax=Lupinus luteus TaxID=3873 RepID=A0AAV1YEF5_LUPLU
MQVVSSTSCFLKLGVKASWDTQQRPSYNPNAPRKELNKKLTKTQSIPSPPPLISTKKEQYISDLLKRNTAPNSSTINGKEKQKQEEEEEDDDGGDNGVYLGYERWLPTPPKVVKPRSVFNAATLAYIGDCIYELYARRHFLFPPLGIEEYNVRVTAVVRCEAQDALLLKLLNSDFLSDQEKDVLRWGKNIDSTSKTKTKKRAGSAVYSRASSLETLVGYLYMTNVIRLEKLMSELGFSVDSSIALNVEEVVASELNDGKR